jgi:hypothetical protein
MRTHGIWIGVATLGILVCTSLTLGVIAYRKFRKEKQPAGVEAKAPQDANREEPPGKVTGTPPVKPANTPPGKKPAEVQVRGKDKPPAEKSISPDKKASETPASDPEFERVWAECLKTAQIVHTGRANAVVKPLASLSEIKQLEARIIMKKTDTNPYQELPNTIEFLHHFGLTIWAMQTGALKAFQDPGFKIFAVGAWDRSNGPPGLFGMAARFSWLKAEDRIAVVEAVSSKTPVQNLSPRIRYLIIKLEAEKWLGPRSFELVWDELRAESDELNITHAGVTALTIKRYPPNTQVVIEAAMRRVEAVPDDLSQGEGEALLFRYNLSVWHQAMRARAAVADPDYKRAAKILWETGVSWHDLALVTRQLYLEIPPTRARVIAAVTGNTPTREIDPNIRKWISDNGGKKWLER